MDAPARQLIADVRSGIEAHGVVPVGDGTAATMYAYEVDGLGGALKDFDDPNVPLLLSMPLLCYSHYDRRGHLPDHQAQAAEQRQPLLLQERQGGRLRLAAHAARLHLASGAHGAGAPCWLLTSVLVVFMLGLASSRLGGAPCSLPPPLQHASLVGIS
jgi:hypothetical protein